MEEKMMTERESLDLIAQMINKAKDVCHDTGIAAIIWGTVIAVCSLVRLSEIHFGYELPFDIYLLTLIAVIPQIYFNIKAKKERKVKTYGDAFTEYLWAAFGISIFLLVYTTANMSGEWAVMAKEYKQLSGHITSFRIYEFSAPLFLMLYGLPTFVTGTSMKFKPMLFGGLFCWVCSIITVHTTIKIDLILMALSAVFAWLIPGIIMEKDYRKAKSGLAAANV
jgi:hypothetical protein